MLKKILLLLIFSTALLLADNTLDNFLNEQIKIESQLLDQNLSLEKKVDIKKEQEIKYQMFLLEYATNKEEYILEANPYRDEVNKLKLRLNSNKFRGNTNAVMRDEVLLKTYAMRYGIREAFHEILQQTESESKSFFKDKINDTLVKYFSK